jgi:hypothetical protein
MTGSPVAACERSQGAGWLGVFLEASRSVAADDVPRLPRPRPRPMIDEPFLTEAHAARQGASAFRRLASLSASSKISASSSGVRPSLSSSIRRRHSESPRRTSKTPRMAMRVASSFPRGSEVKNPSSSADRGSRAVAIMRSNARDQRMSPYATVRRLRRTMGSIGRLKLQRKINLCR